MTHINQKDHPAMSHSSGGQTAKPYRRRESGQSIVLLALGFIGLIGFVGLTTDLSVAFVRYAQLSRSVDSAAIAAANQMRQNIGFGQLGLAARQFIEFYGVDPEDVWVDTCLTARDRPEEVCKEDQSKLVRVTAYEQSPTYFMRLLGINTIELWASAVSQTAALDVVMILDVSESMLDETTLADFAYIESLNPDSYDGVRDINYRGVVYRPAESQRNSSH